MVHSHKNPGIYSKWNYLLNRLFFFNFKNLINRPSYNYFKTSYKRDKIDIGAAIIKTPISTKVIFLLIYFENNKSYTLKYFLYFIDECSLLKNNFSVLLVTLFSRIFVQCPP